MFNLTYLFFVGMGISFLGALPLGTLNITAMQIAIEEHVRNAFKFALGVAIVEIAYVRLSLTGIYWVLKHQQLFYWLEWLTVILFLVLGILSLLSVRKKHTDKRSILLNNNTNRFFLGFTMSALNPVQIPFWFLWSTYLTSTGVLQNTPTAFNIYIAGIAVGTLAGLALFIYGGKWLIAKLGGGNKLLPILVGGIFILSAIIQCYRVINSPLEERLKIKEKHSAISMANLHTGFISFTY